MATKSFLKTVEIKDKQLGETFSKALVECEDTSDVDVEFKSKPIELKGDAVKKFFDRYRKLHA